MFDTVDTRMAGAGGRFYHRAYSTENVHTHGSSTVEGVPCTGTISVATRRKEDQVMASGRYRTYEVPM